MQMFCMRYTKLFKITQLSKTLKTWYLRFWCGLSRYVQPIKAAKYCKGAVKLLSTPCIGAWVSHSVEAGTTT